MTDTIAHVSTWSTLPALGSSMLALHMTIIPAVAQRSVNKSATMDPRKNLSMHIPVKAVMVVASTVPIRVKFDTTKKTIIGPNTDT
jgi:hypothetical protein